MRSNSCSGWLSRATHYLNDLLLSGSLFTCAIHIFALAKLHRLWGLLEGSGSCVNHIHECQRVIIVMHFEHIRIHILWYVVLYSPFLNMYHEIFLYMCVFLKVLQQPLAGTWLYPEKREEEKEWSYRWGKGQAPDGYHGL